jgi:CheY-like chemotaxis protein
MMQQNILIADDELDIQMLLSLFFERQGYQIVRVRDGYEAIDAARAYTPDLLLLDVQMPRKNGIEVVRELRADPRFVDTPMIAITAYVRDYPVKDLLQLGFTNVIFKPFEFADVEARVAAALQEVYR